MIEMTSASVPISGGTIMFNPLTDAETNCSSILIYTIDFIVVLDMPMFVSILSLAYRHERPD